VDTLTYGTEIMYATFREGVIQKWYGSRMKLLSVFTLGTQANGLQLPVTLYEHKSVTNNV